jgi:hypothetical protein
MSISIHIQRYVSVSAPNATYRKVRVEHRCGLVTEQDAISISALLRHNHSHGEG